MNRKLVILMAVTFFGVAAIAVVFLAPGDSRAHDASARPVVESFAEEQSPVTRVAAAAEDLLSWSRFRGPNGSGISNDERIPTQWNDTQNLKWKTKLLGPGSSSPVVTEQHVFITYYSGYGEDRSGAGDIEKLQRHLSCVNRADGSIAWTRTIAAVLPEDRYQGMGVPEHGYATNSPVTDGKSVFAFFGKAGVYAYDLNGSELWHVSVGTESGNRGWGSAASPILYGDMIIVNAAEESHAVVALNKHTGAVVWRAEASALELCYSTPAIVHVNDNRDDIVIAVPGEIWGLNPLTGKLIWFVETSLTENLSPSIIVDGINVYAFGGYRSSGSVAVRAGGQGDVTQTTVLWTSRNSSYVATPVLWEKKLHWIDDRGMYYCANAETGELIHRARTPGISSGERPVYASPLVINGKIYAQTRSSGLFVLDPTEQFKVVSQNKFPGDESTFNATPAVDGGQLFLRSYDYLYCIAKDE